MFDLLLPLGAYALGFIGVGALLSVPVFRRAGPVPGLRAAVEVGLLMLFPAAYFLLSAAMVPDWKGGARAGWLDGFHEGKLALSPLVLWAVVAAWADAVLPAPPARPAWRTLGLLAGALTAGVCLLIGLFIHGGDQPPLMVVPVLTAAHYARLAARALRAAPPGPGPLAGLGALGLSLFGGALVWSHRVYTELPDEPPDCFVVTAASRGHTALVGPLEPVWRGGRLRAANAQLRELWAFEDRWAARWPRSHRAVRAVYAVVGPWVAARARSRWAADLLFVVLWPVQVVVRRVGLGGMRLRSTLF